MCLAVANPTNASEIHSEIQTRVRLTNSRDASVEPFRRMSRNISMEPTIITRRVSEGFTPPSLAYASGYENVAFSYAE